ncbi:MAG: hypothetical protein KKF00_07895 [Proteobacteria bacterium]|nr:hypothetical protein [Pseudomonadota bacterium]
MINPIISKKCDIKPLPFPVYSGTIAFLLLAGLADSIYLSVHHYLVYTDIWLGDALCGTFQKPM